ncbi:MAG: HDOD domain-containing protein [Gammaproteobacteria bacterium]|nr:HDOD domain-containing protein [Gammaproteobacteria bacterium]MBQ0840095.1 HDOD domain-containing protein [Gammaproteobacteria bacterium]
MSDLVYVGRQSIYDRDFNVAAYELLYRSGNKNFVDVADHGLATAELLSNVFTSIGFEDLVGDKPAFINMPREFLVGSYPIPEINANIVVEILEHVEPDAEVIEALLILKKRGYTLALDDYVFAPEHEPFLKIVDIIKLDVADIGIEQLSKKMAQLKQYEARLLAEKVETQSEAEQCLAMGFDLFQGYYFSYPKIVSGRKISGNQIAIVELANKLHQPNVDVGQLTELISHDVALSYKLLRYVNSAMYGFEREITSIDETVFILGLDTLVRLVHVVMAGSFSEDSTHVLESALVRALMCEAAAVELDKKTEKGTFFMVGLFSCLDALLGIPLTEALAELPIGDDVKGALLDGSGEMGGVLNMVVDYCNGGVDDTSLGPVDSKRLMGFYLDVVPMARQYVEFSH